MKNQFAMRARCPSLRLYFPAKPQLSKANVGGTDDYAVLGSRYKAAHVKTLIWFLAKKTQETADLNPEDFWQHSE